METHDLIRAIAADSGRTGMSMRKALWAAAALATLAAALSFFAMLGPRPDIFHALGTARFPFKFVLTLTLAATAFSALKSLSHPNGHAGKVGFSLLAAPVLLAVATIAELALLPSGEWAARLVGANGRLCLVFIPLIGLAPLVVFLFALRYGATTRPALAGGVAGLLAGGLAATFYAAHCPDDSPLFVATWYTLAIAGMAAAGALVAPRLTRW